VENASASPPNQLRLSFSLSFLDLFLVSLSKVTQNVCRFLCLPSKHDKQTRNTQQTNKTLSKTPLRTRAHRSFSSSNAQIPLGNEVYLDYFELCTELELVVCDSLTETDDIDLALL
jgi:hypothetical protein